MRSFIVGALDPEAGTNEFQRADVAPFGSLGDGMLTAGDTVQARRYVAGLEPKIGGGGAEGLSELSLGALGGSLWDSQLDGSSRWLRVAGASGSPGGQVTISIEMMPMGNETASSFTLYYDPVLLSNPTAALPTGLPADTVLTINSSEQSNGRVMLLVDSADVLGAATQIKKIVNITFDIAQSAPYGQTEVSFGNWPTLSTISDPFGNLVSTGFTSGLVTIAEPSVDVNGRVLTPGGLGLRNAQVTLTDPSGTSRTTPTSSLGFFSFPSVTIGQTVRVRVNSRRYRFEEQFVTIANGMAEMQFVGIE